MTTSPVAPRGRPLRVAMLSLHTSPLMAPGSADAGGMNVVVLEEAKALAAQGCTVDLFTRRTDPDAPAVVRVAAGLRLIHLDAGAPAPLAKSAMEQAILPFADALEDHLRSASADGAAPYDVVHAHHWFSGVAALASPRATELPLVQSFHSVAAPASSGSLAEGEPAESSGRIDGERRASQCADLVVAVSDAEARTISDRYGVPASGIAVVRPGVSPAVFHPPAEPRTVPARPMMLFAARLQPLKAPDLALDVLARIGDELDARLVLAGAASDDFSGYADEILRDAARLGVADRLELVGSADRERLAELMRAAAIVLVPSWSETFGLVALEAQATGAPVVAWTGAGGVVEAVERGGLTIPTRDPDVWTDEIRRLLADPARYRAMSRDAIAFGRARSWDASARALETAYAEAIRRHADRPSRGSLQCCGPSRQEDR